MNIEKHWQKFLKERDDFSFSQIYSWYIDQLYAYGRHLGFEEELCMDAIQDVFFKLYATRSILNNIQNIGPYLFRSVKHRLIDLNKRETRSERIEHVEDSFTIEVSILDKIIDEEETEIIKQKINALLNHLTSQQKEAVYMRYTLGFSYEEIGEVFEINSSSVRKMMYRSMEKLRNQLKKENVSWATLLLIAFLN